MKKRIKNKIRNRIIKDLMSDDTCCGFVELNFSKEDSKNLKDYLDSLVKDCEQFNIDSMCNDSNISEEAMKMIESSCENLKKSIVGEPINFEKLKELL